MLKPKTSICSVVLVTVALSLFALPNPAIGSTVDVLPAGNLVQRVDQGSAVDQQLKPAREAFESGDVNRSRELLVEISAAAKALPHQDVQLAIWFLGAGRNADAIRTMEKAALTEADSMDLRYLFAEVARAQGRFFDAWTHATAGEQAAVRSRWSPEYVTHVKRLLKQTKASVADARGDWKASLQLHSELNESAEPTIQNEMAIGVALFHLDDHVESEKRFRAAAAMDGASLIPELALAKLYDSVGNAEKSEKWLGSTESLDEQTASTVRLEHVKWLIRHNRPDDAMRIATEAKPPEASHNDFAFLIAMAKRMKGDFSGAEAIVTKLHRAAPQSVQVGNQLALLLIESDDEGKRGRALQLAEKNLRALPKSRDTISTYAWIKHRLGESDEADKVFAVLLKGGQLSRDMAYYVAQVKAAIGKTKEAELLTKAAEASDGEFFNAHRFDVEKP